MTTKYRKTTSLLRRSTLAVLVLAPVVSYAIPAAMVGVAFDLSDITNDFPGFLSFLVLLFNPYLGLAALVAWLGRSLTRAWMLLIASVVIGGAGVFLWYDLLVREASVFSFLALIGVVALQWYGIIATAIVTAIVWAVERGLSRPQVVGVLTICAVMAAACSDPPPPEVMVPAQQIAESPGAGEIPPGSIVQGLPWEFTTTTEQSAPGEPLRILFVSKDPITRAVSGDVFLRASLTTRTFDRPGQAAEAFVRNSLEADQDTGLTYAWDLLVVDGTRIFHLHADCLFSEGTFDTMSCNLYRLIEGDAVQSLRCRCGGGCEIIENG